MVIVGYFLMDYRTFDLIRSFWPFSPHFKSHPMIYRNILNKKSRNLAVRDWNQNKVLALVFHWSWWYVVGIVV